MTIQDTIRIQLGDKSRPSEHDLLCFVGMIETGEARYHDFLDVGGPTLLAAVAYHHGYCAAMRTKA